MNNITRGGGIDLTDLKYMNLSEGDRHRHLVRAGDLLFNRTNSVELVGKTGIVRHPAPEHDSAGSGRYFGLAISRKLIRAYTKRCL